MIVLKAIKARWLTALAVGIMTVVYSNSLLARIFDKNPVPAVISWKVAATLPDTDGQVAGKGLAGAVCGIYKNYLVIAGGCNFPDAMPWAGGSKVYYKTVFVYPVHKASGKLGKPLIYSMATPVAYCAVCTTPYGVFAGGGENAHGLTATCSLLKPGANGQTQLITALPPLPAPVTNAAAAYSKGSVYVVGGEDANGTTGRMYKLDLQAKSSCWVSCALLPAAASHLAFIAIGRTIWAAGGRQKIPGMPSTFFKHTFFYTPETNSWAAGPNLPKALSAAAGVAIAPGEGVMISGDDGTTFNKVEQAMIGAAGAHGLQKEAFIAQRIKLQEEHPGFLNQVISYCANDRVITVAAGTLPVAPVTANACVYNDRFIFVAGGEVRAGVRTPAILMGTIQRGK